MTPAQQFAESVKYTARPVIIIPFSGQFVIMSVRLANRDYIGTFSPAELARWAENDFARQQSLQEAAKAKEIARNFLLPSDLDIDFTL